MDDAVLRVLRARFVALASEYAERLGERREHIVIKRDHSLRVHALATKIVAAEGLTPPAAHLAAALVHDVGRFPQFERFGTYRDDESVDHGEEGARFLEGGNFLEAFGPHERACITEAVRLHNKRLLPPGMDPLARSICDLVRDADKIDIVRVVMSRMQASGSRDPVITLGLADEPEAWTGAVLDAAAAGENPSYTQLRYINDFLLLLASWGPQLVHGASRAIFADRGYLGRLFSLLPDNDRFRAVKAGLAVRLAA